MTKPLSYARIYLNDLLGVCTTSGFKMRERGILLTLLWIQHMQGSLPADMRQLQELVGNDASPAELGIPVIQESNHFAPPGVGPESLVEMLIDGNPQQREVNIAKAAANIFFDVASTLGIARPAVTASANEFQEALARAQRVHSGKA